MAPPSPARGEGGRARRRFQFASDDFNTLRAFFCNFVILAVRQPDRAGPCTRSSRFEASEPIPFPGADSVFSSGCGAISGRLRLALSLSRRDPADRNASVQKSTIGFDGLRYTTVRPDDSIPRPVSDRVEPRSSCHDGPHADQACPIRERDLFFAKCSNLFKQQPDPLVRVGDGTENTVAWIPFLRKKIRYFSA
jgi:hypothetical protein